MTQEHSLADEVVRLRRENVEMRRRLDALERLEREKWASAVKALGPGVVPKRGH